MAGLRDEEGLARLPEPLAGELRAHWARVREVVADARAKAR